MVIKYLGSKRTLIPLLTRLAVASEAKTALDLFTGTTRVARAFKTSGMQVTAVDTASYSRVFAEAWIALDAASVNQRELLDAITRLNAVRGEAGYFTQSFCLDARYFQPKNGERIDAIRALIESEYQGTWMYHPLLASLILAADRVDSTTGLQMAFLKNWSARSFNDLQLRDPELLAGGGRAIQGDAAELVADLEPVDLAYLDPPYNQHRYFTNYHIWETLVRWDSPQGYGIANKRLDSRDDSTKSAFNSKRTMPSVLADTVRAVRAETLILSYNNESWLDRDQLMAICEPRGRVEIIDVDFKRYVGSQIGIYNKAGERVGTPGQKRNLEHVVIVGEPARVQRILNAATSLA